MGDPFQTKDGSLTKKQQAFVNDGGKLSNAQSAYNNAEMSKGELSAKLKKTAGVAGKADNFELSRLG